MPNGMTVHEMKMLKELRAMTAAGKFIEAKQRAVKWINANKARCGHRRVFARTVPFLYSQLPEKFLSPLDPSGTDT